MKIRQLFIYDTFKPVHAQASWKYLIYLFKRIPLSSDPEFLLGQPIRWAAGHHPPFDHDPDPVANPLYQVQHMVAVLIPSILGVLE